MFPPPSSPWAGGHRTFPDDMRTIAMLGFPIGSHGDVRLNLTGFSDDDVVTDIRDSAKHIRRDHRQGSGAVLHALRRRYRRPRAGPDRPRGLSPGRPGTSRPTTGTPTLPPTTSTTGSCPTSSMARSSRCISTAPPARSRPRSPCPISCGICGPRGTNSSPFPDMAQPCPRRHRSHRLELRPTCGLIVCSPENSLWYAEHLFGFPAPFRVLRRCPARRGSGAR